MTEDFNNPPVFIDDVTEGRSSSMNSEEHRDIMFIQI